MNKHHRPVKSSLFLAAAAVAVFSTAAPAATAFKTGPKQPFCDIVIALEEYIQAVETHDQPWIDSLPSCRLLDAGLPVTIVENDPDVSSDAPFAHVRIQTRSKRLDGYTRKLGLTPSR